MTSPAPWVALESDGEIVITDAHGEPVARLNCYGQERELGNQDRSDGQLIAAAPLLLRQLKDCIAALQLAIMRLDKPGIQSIVEYRIKIALTLVAQIGQ